MNFWISYQRNGSRIRYFLHYLHCAPILKNPIIQWNNLKALNSILYGIFVTISLIACGIIFISYGWISYATFTYRPGMYGNLHWYYRMSPTLFGLYQMIIAISSLVFIVRLLYAAYLDNQIKIRNTLIQFGIFILLLILCEVYLDTRFVSKGWKHLWQRSYP